MTASKEFLADLKEKYQKTERLVSEESKLDPPTEPFKSHYAARDILHELALNIKNHIETLKTSEPPASLDEVRRFTFILAHITVDLGKIYNFTEEISTAVKYLNQSIDLLKSHESTPSSICAELNALNESGILWMNRGETEKAKELLEKAENIHDSFVEANGAALSIHDLFDSGDVSKEKEGTKILQKFNQLTLFYLAQVFGSLGDLEKSAIYCHTTLKKQLQLGDFESIDWALNAATLSQYFCTNTRFTEARHHLAAATQILLEYEAKMLKPSMNEEERKATEDNFNHRLADVNRCWVKYGLNLMSDSRDRLLQDTEDTGVTGLKISAQSMLLFGSEVDSAYENIVTDRYLLDIDDARPVFLTTQKWIEKAKSYYTADTEATEYSKIIQDHALAYKHLAFFESDPSNQAKMHKRRIDLLDDLLQMLNKVFYMNIVREVLYELGTAYSNILDIKLDTFEQSQREADGAVNPHALKKINDLITKSCDNFLEYISTYYQAKTQILKPDLAEDELIPIAFAHFQVARISYKFITPDKQLQLKNLSICLDNYRKFIAMCDKTKEVGDRMKGEVGVSKEMVTLLPIKLQRLRESIETTIPAINST